MAESSSKKENAEQKAKGNDAPTESRRGSEAVTESGRGAVEATWMLPPGTKPGAAGKEVDARPATMLGVYELIEKIGQGGMGAVWKARHTKLDKLVALKILPPQFMSDENAVARFEREMKAVGKLEHPHIVRAMDAGEAAGIHFLVMEYVEGVDLSKLVQTRGPRPVAEACQMVRHAALGLAHAHEHGLVHRDIKPSNLLLWKKGLVKILDLGLARLNCERTVQSEALTMQGEILGTPDYMAPEQWNSPNLAGPPADLYALGCTLVYLLTGKAVFGGEQHSSFSQKMKGHVLEAPPRLRELREDVPEELEALCAKLLAKLPADRPGSAKEVAGELQAMIKRWSKTPPASDAIAWTPAKASAGDSQAMQAAAPPSGKARFVWAAVAVGLLVSVAVGAWVISLRPDRGNGGVAAVDKNRAQREAAEAAATEQAKKLYVAGREFCFVSDEWEKGIKLLAEGHEAGIRAAARKELEGVLTPEAQAEAGVLWYEAGVGIKEEPDNWHCFRRARYWLTRAVGEGTQRSDAPWWDKAQKTLELLPILRANLLIKAHTFNSELITIRRNRIDWMSKGGSGPNEISSPRTGAALPAFHSKYSGTDRHVFGPDEVRKILPEGVDFSLARIRLNGENGPTSSVATAAIVAERSDDTKVTIRLAEWDGKSNSVGNYEGDFTMEVMVGFGGGAGAKGN